MRESMVVICPRTLKKKVFDLTSKMGESLGMSVPVVKKANGPQTHWACHNWCSDKFAGYMNREIYHPDIPSEEVDRILDQCIISVGATRYNKKLIKRNHLDHVLKKNKLQKMVDVSKR